MKKHIYTAATLILFTFTLILGSPQSSWEWLSSAANITELYKDKDTIWAATFGAGIFRIECKTFAVTNINKKNSVLPDDVINSIAKDTSGFLWAATENGGLVRLQSTNDTVFTTLNSILPSNMINCVAVDSNNTVWISTSKGILYLKDGIFKKMTLNGQTDFTGTKIIVDRNNTVLAGTDRGLMVINGDTITTLYNSSGSCIPQPYIMGLAVDKSHNLWLGTHSLSGGWVTSLKGSGATFFDGHECFTLSQSNIGLEEMLPDNNVTYISVAPDDRVWISTEKGISIVDTRNDFSITSETIDSYNSGLPGNRVQPIVFDSEERAWIGTRRNGLTVFDGENWRQLTLSHNKIPCEKTVQVALDGNGSKWFLHRDEDLFCAGYIAVSGTDGTTWQMFDSESDGLSTCKAFLQPDPFSDDLFIAGHTGFYKVEGDSLTKIFSTVMQRSDIEGSVAFAENGDVWLASSGPLWRWAQRNEWISYGDSNNVYLEDVRDVSIGPGETVWAVTDSGVARFDGTSWSYHGVNIPKALCFQGEPDSKGGLWLRVLDRGNLSTIHPFVYFKDGEFNFVDQGQFTRYGVQDRYLDEYDRLWVATSNGLLMSDGSMIHEFNSTNCGLQTDKLNCFFVDSSKTMHILAQTSSSIQIYTASDTTFTLTSEYPQKGITVYDFLIDNYENIYIATSEGVLTYKTSASVHTTRRHVKKIAEQMKNIRVAGNAIRFSLIGESDIHIEAFSANGRIISGYKAGTHSSGNHVIPLANVLKSNAAGGVIFFKVSTKHSTNVIRCIQLQ